MTQIPSFDQALADSEGSGSRHLLLGNGFSIACDKNIFTYRSLFEKAFPDDSSRIYRVFNAIDTKDFEHGIRSLEETARLVALYNHSPAIPLSLRQDASDIRETLIKTIVQHHPADPYQIGSQGFQRCKHFLSNFVGGDQKGHVYTLNYDLLLYWALMWDRAKPNTVSLVANDGFGKSPELDNDQLIWIGSTTTNKQRIHYLHGALHLVDTGTQLVKYKSSGGQLPLMDQIRAAIPRDMFPLFVAEGTSVQKLRRIKRSPYLNNSLRHFTRRMRRKQDTLFVFGHSFDDSDDHVLRRIKSGNIRRLYVGLHGDPDSSSNATLRIRAAALAQAGIARDAQFLQFYGAESAQVWK